MYNNTYFFKFTFIAPYSENFKCIPLNLKYLPKILCINSVSLDTKFTIMDESNLTRIQLPSTTMS